MRAYEGKDNVSLEAESRSELFLGLRGAKRGA